MNQLILKFKNATILAAAGVLLLGVLAGFNLVSGGKAQAFPGRGSNYFLNLDGVAGESKDAQHIGQIDLDSFAWSKGGPGLEETVGSATSGAGAGRVQLHDISFTHKIDKASPSLMLACATGKHYKEAVLYMRKAGGENRQDFVTITMSDVIVTSYHAEGQDQNAPTDEFSLNFAKVQFSETPQKLDGALDQPVITTWDFTQNKGQ